MVIVAGWMQLDAKDRDAFLELKREATLATRAEKGCIEYVFTPDPFEPGRARVFERWETLADQEAHVKLAISGQSSSPQPYPVLGQELYVHTVSDSRPWARPR